MERCGELPLVPLAAAAALAPLVGDGLEAMLGAGLLALGAGLLALGDGLLALGDGLLALCDGREAPLRGEALAGGCGGGRGAAVGNWPCLLVPAEGTAGAA